MPRNSAASNSARAARRDLRRPIKVALLGLLLLDLLFFVLAFQPAGRSFAEQRQALDRLRSEYKARREGVGRLQKIEANLAEARRQGDEFYTRRFLPKATGFSLIMEEVDKVASATGVRKGPVNYTLAEVKDRAGIEQVEITTTLEGEYPKIVQFINHLEQSSLFLIIDSMNVGTGAARGAVKLSVRLVSYFRVA